MLLLRFSSGSLFKSCRGYDGTGEPFAGVLFEWMTDWAAFIVFSHTHARIEEDIPTHHFNHLQSSATAGTAAVVIVPITTTIELSRCTRVLRTFGRYNGLLAKLISTRRDPTIFYVESHTF